MTLRHVILITATLFAVAMAGENPGYTPDRDWTPPAEAVARPNPLAHQAAAVVVGGRKLFAKNCSECHGSDGSGRRKAADLRLPVVQRQSDGALWWKITNGNPRRGMPSFSNLP